MKNLILLCTLAIMIASCAGEQPTKVAEEPQRNYSYEAYCDSIWSADPEYYLDVLSETDEYCEYVEQHGAWWE